jgi:COMPASS component SWD2
VNKEIGMEKVILEGPHLDSLQVAKTFQDNSKPITSIDFDESGAYLITASEDETMNVYDTLQGK